MGGSGLNLSNRLTCRANSEIYSPQRFINVISEGLSIKTQAASFISLGSRPTVQYLSSLCELPQALLPYYTQGYVLAALHPIILSVGRTRALPLSLLYRAILARPRPRYV